MGQSFFTFVRKRYCIPRFTCPQITVDGKKRLSLQRGESKQAQNDDGNKNIDEGPV